MPSSMATRRCSQNGQWEVVDTLGCTFQREGISLVVIQVVQNFGGTPSAVQQEVRCKCNYSVRLYCNTMCMQIVHCSLCTRLCNCPFQMSAINCFDTIYVLCACIANTCLLMYTSFYIQVTQTLNDAGFVPKNLTISATNLQYTTFHTELALVAELDTTTDTSVFAALLHNVERRSTNRLASIYRHSVTRRAAAAGIVNAATGYVANGKQAFTPFPCILLCYTY